MPWFLEPYCGDELVFPEHMFESMWGDAEKTRYHGAESA